MDEEIRQRVFQQMLDIWIIPEIEKRKKQGQVSDKFVLSQAQIIFSLDKGFNKIRINEEVKAIVEGKATRDIKKGEVVYENDLEDINNVKLTDEDSNCAHITLLFFKGRWIISFDFRYNKEIIKEHIKASKEFYQSAIENLNNGRLRPFYEDSFGAAELSAKSILLAVPDEKILYGRNHLDKIIKLRNWAELGNVKMDFSTTLSKLKFLRDSARYLNSDAFKNENPNEFVPIIKEMIDFAEKSIE